MKTIKPETTLHRIPADIEKSFFLKKHGKTILDTPLDTLGSELHGTKGGENAPEDPLVLQVTKPLWRNENRNPMNPDLKKVKTEDPEISEAITQQEGEKIISWINEIRRHLFAKSESAASDSSTRNPPRFLKKNFETIQ